MILHPSFLKAVALATIAIVAVSLSPISKHIKDRVVARATSSLEQIINAVISAFIITFLRPPTDTA
jgi:type II secretory pathway pseudopilin PulG